MHAAPDNSAAATVTTGLVKKYAVTIQQLLLVA